MITPTDMQKNNEDLQKKYENIYVEGEEKYFSKFVNGVDISETNQVVIKNLPSLAGKTLIDLGCGEGGFINEVAVLHPARAVGIDYSPTAIENAKKKYQGDNISFICAGIEDFDQNVDIIVSNGTFEHMDDPFSVLEKCAGKLLPGGRMYITCPHFYNLRGFIWITLSKLFNVPMSLTDIHNITPIDVRKWAERLNFTVVHTESYDHIRVTGELMLKDMQKRLTNALRDAGMDNSRVPELLAFCEDFFLYQKEMNDGFRMDGINMLYVLEKPNN
jgi:2-polyprenyl-3-methyl-5-hydroxy-6-metoxy-1,4-benzoquinol methylase